MKNCVLRIWYQKDGKSYPYPQGKIFESNGKWVYLADMTSSTLWKKFNGYAISEQILEAFKKAKIRPQIIYRRKDLGTLYVSTPSKFKKSGIPVKYGSHTQYILCLPYWEVESKGSALVGTEPFNLPVMDVSSWLKPEVRWTEDGFYYAS